MGRLNDKIAIVTDAGPEAIAGKLAAEGATVVVPPGRGERQTRGVAGRRRDPHGRQVSR